MKKINNKQISATNYDYLNFIRKNQQIVKQFKQISQLDKKVQDLKKMFNNTGNQQKATIEVDRYSETPRIQDSLYNYRQRAKFQITSLKEVNPNQYKKQFDSPIKNRLADDFVQKNGTGQIYSRNLSIPWKMQKNNNQKKQKIHEASSQVKFPKLSTKISQNQEQKQLRSSSQSSLSYQKQILTAKKSRKQKSERLNSDNWKKNYAPLVLDSNPAIINQNNVNSIRCKVNSLKLTDVNKNKINDKLVRTYYDYQNLIQLKQRVAQLLPTFKPLQSKKRQKVHILHAERIQPNELQQYLQANMIGSKNRKVNKYDCEPNKKNDSKRKINQQISNEDFPISIQSKNIQNYQSYPIDIDKETLEKQEQKLQKQLTLQKNQLASPPKNRHKKQSKIIQNISNSNQQQTVYQNKIVSYRQFLFLVNFAHRVFDPLVFRDDPQKHKIQNKYKFFIGPGNNGMLLKSLMKRRFWWTQVDDYKQANFVWTQLKINTYYQYQKKTQLDYKYDKLDSEHPYVQPKQKKLMKSKQNLQHNKKQQQPPKVGGILRGQLPQGQKKIFTNADNLQLSKMMQKAIEQNPQLKNFSKFQTRLKYLPQNFLRKREQDYNQVHIHNHLFYNYEIGNKKALFYNLKHYYELIGADPYNSIPLTFHIKKGVNDPQYAKFMKQYKKLKAELEKAQKGNTSKKKLSRNVWIVKPGQLSNRGNGITVIDQIYELNTILKSKDKHNNGIEKTYIVQKYIEKPLLYKNRKFDIRHYMMISRLHGRMRAYWFSQGYIRTSSAEYNLDEVSNVMIHLTNDAIQKYGSSYGKYEEGNKLSYAQFQRYLDNTYPQKKYSFIESIYPRMKQIATDAIKSTYLWMDPDQLEHNFQIFGLDFMIDSSFNVWLIEVNTNPCLQLSSGLLGRIIPTMVENALRLAVDPIFPPTAHYLNTLKYLAPDTPMERLQFQLIFDQSRDGKQIQQLFTKHGKANCGQIQQEDQTYENEGKQIDLGGDLQ